MTVVTPLGPTADDLAPARPDDDLATPSPDELVASHLDLARALAARYRDRGEHWDDLVQVAFLGLVKASRGYRSERGPSFPSYAIPTITGEIRRHFRDHGWDVRPPRRLQELRSRLRSAERELLQEDPGGVDERVLARHLGTTVAEVREARQAAAAYSAVSLDAHAGSGDDTTVGETLEADDGAAAVVDDLIALRPALAGLTERDRRILAMRFVADATQSQIAAELGISQMQVSRLLSSVLHRLRDQLACDERPVRHVPTRVPGRAVDRGRRAGEAVPACSRKPSRSSARTSTAA